MRQINWNTVTAEFATASTANSPMALSTMLDCFFSMASKKKAFQRLMPYWTLMFAITSTTLPTVSSHAFRAVAPCQKPPASRQY